MQIKLKLYLLNYLIIVFCSQCHYGNHPYDGKSEHARYHVAKIQGHLSYVDHQLKEVYQFEVANDTNVFYEGHFTYMGESEPFENYHFQRFAEIGDSVFKNRFSDTLILFKNGKQFFYADFP